MRLTNVAFITEWSSSGLDVLYIIACICISCSHLASAIFFITLSNISSSSSSTTLLHEFPSKALSLVTPSTTLVARWRWRRRTIITAVTTLLLLRWWRRSFAFVVSSTSLLQRFVSASFASTFSASADCEEYGVSGVYFSALILAAFGLYVVVSESVTFSVDVMDVYQPGVVVCRVLREESVRFGRVVLAVQ